MDTYDFCDESAIRTLKSTRPGYPIHDAAAAHLEVSINGGDLDTVRAIALDLLMALDT